MSDNHEMFTLKEIAEYLKFSTKTIMRMIQKDEIPYIKISGQWRFIKSDIEAWIVSKKT